MQEASGREGQSKSEEVWEVAAPTTSNHRGGAEETLPTVETPLPRSPPMSSLVSASRK